MRTPKTHLVRWPWVKFDNKIRERVDLIWADVQGAEGDLIVGGAETLKKTKYLHTEYSDDEWYEGQVTLAQIVAMLGETFSMVERWKRDALFKNQSLPD